jgi:hypothetical protein
LLGRWCRTLLLFLCGSGANKQTISTFTGNATRYKEAEDSKLNAAIDVYVSDFGELANRSFSASHS